MLDVSDAVDLLLGGVAPERAAEVKARWGERTDRVRLLDGRGFLLQQLYQTIQVNEIALRQVWLIGYAAWRAVEAYSGVLALLSMSGLPFHPEGLKLLPGQSEADGAFDEALGHVRALGDVETLADFEWPAGVPEPGTRMTTIRDKAIFDMVCMAGGYAFLHEIRHALLDGDDARSSSPEEEERECDRFARSILLDDVAAFAAENGWDPGVLRAKRLLSILIANVVILVVTPRSQWDGSETHPAVRDRINLVLQDAGTDLPYWFWPSAAAILAGFARALGAVPAAIGFADVRELAFKICQGLRSAPT